MCDLLLGIWLSSLLKQLHYFITQLCGIVEFTGLEIARLENDGRSRSGGICR